MESVVSSLPSSGNNLYPKGLEPFGLSEYEARVYVSLVTGGASEARKLSTMCGVPRTKVYLTLKKLIERGLVFELPGGEPRKFASIAPAKALKTLLLRLKEKTSEGVISLVESEEVLSLLEEAYQKTQSTIVSQREEVWTVQGWSEMLRKMKQMLSRAKKSVVVVTTEKGLVLFYKTFGKLLDKLVENGVNVQIAAPINSYNGNLARELGYVCKVKRVNVGSPLLCLCVDHHALFLAKLNQDNGILESETNLGVVCYSSTLCNLFSLLLPILETKEGLINYA